MENWSGKKVIMLGAARQGTALSRYLASKGAQVILTDMHSLDELSASLSDLEKLGIQLHLGGHPLELLEGADCVCVSGGVPLTIPFIQAALQRGIPLSNDSQIFLEACPAQVIGITGSSGKTTTTALVGLMAQKYYEMKQNGHRAWVGGNIGNPLIEQVDQIDEDDLVVLELSSFQLELMTRSPQIAAILNITPNHLDRHGSMQAYIAAKSRILRFQHPGDVAAHGRQSRSGDSADDHQLRAHHCRDGPTTAGPRHATVAAEPGDHGDCDLHDGAADGAVDRIARRQLAEHIATGGIALRLGPRVVAVPAQFVVDLPIAAQGEDVGVYVVVRLVDRRKVDGGRRCIVTTRIVAQEEGREIILHP